MISTWFQFVELKVARLPPVDILWFAGVATLFLREVFGQSSTQWEYPLLLFVDLHAEMLDVLED